MNQAVTVHQSETIPDRIQRRMTPALFAADAATAKRFWEFFAAKYRNANTREAYLRAAFQFADACDGAGLELADVDAMVVSQYIEHLTKARSAATVKQHLAAIRKLFDFLVIHHHMDVNPALSVEGPKLVVRKGKTPVLNAEETRQLFDRIDTSTVVGLRDRALIGVMVYSFARVSAAVNMKVEDYYIQGKRAFLVLHEKGGKHHKVPAHRVAQEYLDEYLEAAGIADQANAPLFRSTGRGRSPRVTDRPLTRVSALKMVKRRAKDAGLPKKICNHTFRGTGITNYMGNGGTLEKAAAIANHASTRTTQIYDRSDDHVTLDEIERIHI